MNARLWEACPIRLKRLSMRRSTFNHNDKRRPSPRRQSAPTLTPTVISVATAEQLQTSWVLFCLVGSTTNLRGRDGPSQAEIGTLYGVVAPRWYDDGAAENFNEERDTSYVLQRFSTPTQLRRSLEMIRRGSIVHGAACSRRSRARFGLA
jgi:hypothetical protein